MEKKTGARCAGDSTAARGIRQPFGALESYVPLHNGEIALYRAVREAVPIVDAALMKIIRLVGGLWCGVRNGPSGRAGTFSADGAGGPRAAGAGSFSGAVFGFHADLRAGLWERSCPAKGAAASRRCCVLRPRQ